MKFWILTGIGLLMVGFIIHQIVQEFRTAHCLHCSKLCKNCSKHTQS